MSEIPQIDFGMSIAKSKKMPRGVISLERFILAILSTPQAVRYIQRIVNHEISCREREKR